MMENYTLTARTIPYDASWDVIVVGGGPAGCTAAAAAAAEGAKTLLIEATGCLGGMGTSGLVPAWCPFSDQQQIIYRGLAERVFTACKAGMPHINQEALDWVAIDPELLKRIYDDLVIEAGAEVLFNTALVSVDTDGAGSVSAIIVQNKAGLSAYKAKVFIDCTGDADLVAFAGGAYDKGDAETGELQPATHCFVFSNVDEYGYRLLTHPMAEILASGAYPLLPDRHFCHALIGPGTVGFNAGHMWEVDNTDPLSVSRALITGRKMAAQFRDALAATRPNAFANAHLAATATLMGVRETRRIRGDYALTAEDYFARRSFPDEICRNSYPIDIHHSVARLAENRAGTFHCMDEFPHYGPGESHGIPYRCLTPATLTNVLVAGRSISCDRVVQGSVRVMPVCLAMGEAAGVAAVQATGIARHDVHAVDTDNLRARLRERGAYLPDGVAV